MTSDNAERETTEQRLARWLAERGLASNPFATWIADIEPDLPGYYIELEKFEDLLADRRPVLVYAERGCGKTAYRTMLAAQCRPCDRNAPRLAVEYTYASFAGLLDAHTDPAAIRAGEHVAAIVASGVAALAAAAEADPALAEQLAGPFAARDRAYRARFAPHLPAPSGETSVQLEQLGALGILRDFAELLEKVGIPNLIILVDGLDEWPEAATDLAAACAFLSHLLGSPELMVRSKALFRFFLPAGLEPLISAAPWHRQDRFAPPHYLRWTEDRLIALIAQRLIYFSAQPGTEFNRLGALCDEELRPRIDRELARAAQGIPRAALLLANLLLHRHCEQSPAPRFIAAATWDALKAEWPRLGGALLRVALQPQDLEQDPKREATAATGDAWPVLRADPATRDLWLGSREITGILPPQEERVLTALLQKAGRVCGKDDLIAAGWPDVHDTFGVSDAALTHTIRRIRKALSKESDGVDYIETVRDRGFKVHVTGFRPAPNRQAE